MIRKPNVPPPDDLVLVVGVGAGVVTVAATTVSVIWLVADRFLESVAVNDSSTVPAVAGATKLADNALALFSVTVVPAVCCHK
jgi:hypothetical protein